MPMEEERAIGPGRSVGFQQRRRLFPSSFTPGRSRDARQSVEQRGQHVDDRAAPGRCRGPAAAGQAADEERHADAAFVGAALALAPAGVVARLLWPVVGQEGEHGVSSQSEPVEAREQAAHVVVEGLPTIP